MDTEFRDHDEHHLLGANATRPMEPRCSALLWNGKTVSRALTPNVLVGLAGPLFTHAALCKTEKYSKRNTDLDWAGMAFLLSGARHAHYGGAANGLGNHGTVPRDVCATARAACAPTFRARCFCLTRPATMAVNWW